MSRTELMDVDTVYSNNFHSPTSTSYTMSLAEPTRTPVPTPGTIRIPPLRGIVFPTSSPDYIDIPTVRRVAGGKRVQRATQKALANPVQYQLDKQATTGGGEYFNAVSGKGEVFQSITAQPFINSVSFEVLILLFTPFALFWRFNHLL